MVKTKKIFILEIIIILIFCILNKQNANTSSMDLSKVNIYTSLDGQSVPVPNGFIPSNDEAEQYVNGKFETFKRKWFDFELNSQYLDYIDEQTSTVNYPYYELSTSNYASTSLTYFEIDLPILENGGIIYANWSGYTQDEDLIVLVSLMNKTTNEENPITSFSYGRLGTKLSSMEYIESKVYLEPNAEYSLTFRNYYYDYLSYTNYMYIKEFKIFEINDTGDEQETIRTKSGGYVIYQTDDKNNLSDIDYAKSTYNQYVWVPVNMETLEDIICEDQGKLIGGGIVYHFNAEKNKQYYYYSYEPLIAKQDLTKTYLSKYYKYTTKSQLSQELYFELEVMYESIKTYGGFYISRYEIYNIDSKNPKSVQYKDPYANCNWYTMKRNCSYLAGNLDVTTHMIWESQYALTWEYLIQSGDKTVYEFVQSSHWGNYRNNYFTYKTSSKSSQYLKDFSHVGLLDTGSSEVLKSNNIYDLAGNYTEWTMGLVGTDQRKCNGRHYYYSGSYYSACYIFKNYSEIVNTALSTRVTMYVE